MLVNLSTLLSSVENTDTAVPCFNIFGFEDAIAIIRAAETLKTPVILATNKDMVDFLGVKCLAGMLKPLAEDSSAQVCLHLDHCYEESIVYQAIHHGYSSVMFDGSQLPLEENIERTRNVVKVAHAIGVSVEGEIGSVPYQEGRDHIKAISTIPEEAKIYSKQSGVDAVAVSVGNIHRLNTPSCTIDYSRLKKIESVVNIPLVIHGTTGIKEEDIIKLKKTRVAKFNIGTSLRMVIGHRLRRAINSEPEKYDRRYFMSKIMPYAEKEAKRILQLLS